MTLTSIVEELGAGCEVCLPDPEFPGIVCEEHPSLPWGGSSSAASAHHCGGAGMPCIACSPTTDDVNAQMRKATR